MAESPPTEKESLPPRAKFELISSGAGPRTCAHICVISGRRLFIHGGKSSADPSAKDVKNDFWIFHLDENRWEDLTDGHSPYLSQHCGVASEDNSSGQPRLFLIGGWDGRRRTSDLYSFRTDTLTWEKWSTSGFPVGAGLSSFAVVPIVSAGTKKTSTMVSNSMSSKFTSSQQTQHPMSEEVFFVCGREGGLRTQRKSGNTYLLRCDTQKQQSAYVPNPRGTASRSGHSATGLSHSSQIVLIGGRDDALTEIVVGLKPRPCRGGGGRGGGGDVCGASDFLQRIKSRTSMSKAPPPRHRHVAVPIGNDAILIHGGETFDGKSKTAVADLFLVWFEVSSKDKSSVAKWAKLDAGDSSPPLASHSAVSVGPMEIAVFGGFETKYALDNCYKLTLA